MVNHRSNVYRIAILEFGQLGVTPSSELKDRLLAFGNEDTKRDIGKHGLKLYSDHFDRLSATRPDSLEVRAATQPHPISFYRSVNQHRDKQMQLARRVLFGSPRGSNKLVISLEVVPTKGLSDQLALAGFLTAKRNIAVHAIFKEKEIDKMNLLEARDDMYEFVLGKPTPHPSLVSSLKSLNENARIDGIEYLTNFEKSK